MLNLGKFFDWFIMINGSTDNFTSLLQSTATCGFFLYKKKYMTY